MDRFCDNIVEEILRRLPFKYLHRVRAVARRYNLIVLSPGFRARYWESHSPYLSGVFLQSYRPSRQPCRFLAGTNGRPSATESVFDSDLTFLPRLTPGPRHMNKEIFIVHATAGLLLCSRGEYMPLQFYVCNPVTWQWVALPELPSSREEISGLLSVTKNNGAGSSIKFFQVVLFSHASPWNRISGGCLDLKVFSSATGQWQARRIHVQTEISSINAVTYPSPFLGKSGTVYWIYCAMHKLIAYNCLRHKIQVLPLPISVYGLDIQKVNRCIGERQGGGLRFAHFDYSVLQVWDLQIDDVRGVWWKPVQQVGVTQLVERNPETTALVAKSEYFKRLKNPESSLGFLFSVIGFHPTANIIFLDVDGNLGAYSIEHGTISYQHSSEYSYNDVFPYVHPAHPVEITAIKKAPLCPP